MDSTMFFSKIYQRKRVCKAAKQRGKHDLGVKDNIAGISTLGRMER
jgi:hypothetical protein